jgi:hypothetical protein
MLLRTILNGALLTSIFAAPAWVTFVLMLAALLMLRGHRVFEVIVYGACIDALFGIYVPGFPYLPIYYTTLALLCFLTLELLKPHLVFYAKR